MDSGTKVPQVSAAEHLGSYGLANSQIALAQGSFKLAPGTVKPVTITLKGELLATLKHAHKLKVTLTTKAHDDAKPDNSKTRMITLTLLYK